MAGQYYTASTLLILHIPVCFAQSAQDIHLGIDFNVLIGLLLLLFYCFYFLFLLFYFYIYYQLMGKRLPLKFKLEGCK